MALDLPPGGQASVGLGRNVPQLLERPGGLGLRRQALVAGAHDQRDTGSIASRLACTARPGAEAVSWTSGFDFASTSNQGTVRAADASGIARGTAAGRGA